MSERDASLPRQMGQVPAPTARERRPGAAALCQRLRGDIRGVTRRARRMGAAGEGLIAV